MTVVSQETYAELAKNSMQAHETAALFESVAEISHVSETDEIEDAHDGAGQSVNPYGSPLSLWELKSGKTELDAPKQRSLWSRIKWGVCNEIIETTGGEGRKPEGTLIDEQSRASSRVDMEVTYDLGATWEPMIAKNVAGMSISMWRNAVGDWIVPEGVLIEAHHHMMVRKANRVHIAVLISGTQTRHFIVERDEDLIADIQDAHVQFWKCVDEKRRPKPNGKKDQQIIARLNAIIDPVEKVIDLRGDPDVQKKLALRDKLNSDMKKLDSQVKEINAELQLLMDGLASAKISDTHQLRWIKQPGGGTVSYVKKASAHLRVTKIPDTAAGSGMDDLIERETN